MRRTSTIQDYLQRQSLRIDADGIDVEILDTEQADRAEAAAKQAQDALSGIERAKLTALNGAVTGSATPPANLKAGDLFIDATTGNVYQV